MLGYALRRLLSTVPVLWIALTACFFVLRLAPGGPFDGERPLPPAVKANLAAHYHLDEPLVMQYVRYLGDVLRGDLGPSFVNQDFSVAEQLGIGLPYTLIVGGLAFALAVAVGIGAGVLGALYRNRLGDHALAALILLGLVLPNFLVAPILQLVFGLELGWLPVGGWGGGAVTHLVLPVTVLALPHVARISRLMRGSMIDVMSSDFVRTARGEGHRAGDDPPPSRPQTRADPRRLLPRSRGGLPPDRLPRRRDDLRAAGHRALLHQRRAEP